MATGTQAAPNPRRVQSSAQALAAQRPAPSSQLVIPGDRPADIVAFESELVSFFLDAATLLGIPKSVAAVYGIVFASPKPMSYSEIAARLSFSGGSVSMGLKVLREIGAIRVVTVDQTESRPIGRDRFEPETEMRRLIHCFLVQRVEAQLSRGKARLVVLETAARNYDVPDRKVVMQRLQKLRRWHDRTRSLMPVVKTFLNLTKT